ncbi:MAG: peptidoglycan editing factor PgeF [Clostridiales bacterium]|nr:peptidoglycan editing factor PgeF [Clostridiales bacterium]
MAFQMHNSNGIQYLSSDLLAAVPGIRHGFSTRIGGVSPAPWDSLNLDPKRGDAAENVQENYARFCRALGVNNRRVFLNRQVHDENVRLVTEEDAGKGLWKPWDFPSADSAICRLADTPLVVFSADCGIILLYDPVTRSVGTAHAGWRGAAAGIVAKTVREMQRHFGTDPADLLCAIGPGIGPCCFETGDDVPQAMRNTLGEAAADYMERRGPKWHVDLKAINAHWLRQAGVPAGQIEICPDCTACHPELYWSHRRMGGERGTQVGLIALDS